MARIVWHEAHPHWPGVNPALLIAALWLTLALATAAYDIGIWVGAW